MDIAPSLTQHTVVVCVDKRERAVAIQAALAKTGYRVVLAMSLYDALKFVSQEMPHLVISEALLSDGNAGTLYDRLQQHPTLKKTPILVQVLKKTKDELAPLQGRKFAGFVLGAFEVKTFLAKVSEIIGSHARVSPYFVPVATLGIAPDMTISIEASVVGRSGEQLVSRSGTEVDPAASMLCVPTSPDLGPAVLRMATNLKAGDETFNLFPLNRIVGAGRKWVMNLPEINPPGTATAAAEKERKVVFFEPSEQRFEGFKEILRGYQIDLLHAKTMAAATAMVKRDPENIAAVYLHELLGDASGIEWKNTYGKLPLNSRPPVICGTTSMNARSTSDMRYIKRPFGMGLFVEMLQASFEKAGDLAKVAGKNASNDIKGVPVRFQAQARLVGIDESGGIMEVRFPLLKGSRFVLNHEFLLSAWDGNASVQVSGSTVTTTRADVWHARFEAIGAGMSKVKYWEKLEKKISALPPPPADTEKSA